MQTTNSFEGIHDENTTMKMFFPHLKWWKNGRSDELAWSPCCSGRPWRGLFAGCGVFATKL